MSEQAWSIIFEQNYRQRFNMIPKGPFFETVRIYWALPLTEFLLMPIFYPYKWTFTFEGVNND
jgi:hypothetical protein